MSVWCASWRFEGWEETIMWKLGGEIQKSCFWKNLGTLRYLSDGPAGLEHSERGERKKIWGGQQLGGISSVQSLSLVWLFATPWTAACQASLSITNSRSLLKLMSIESVMPSNHLILCHSFLLLPSVFPSIRVFSNESALHIRWPEYWSFSFSISHSNEYPRLISFRMDWLDLLAVQGTQKSSQIHSSFSFAEHF